jgi:hypothetical protein
MMRDTMKTDIETLRQADWAAVEIEVMQKIRFLRAAVAKLEPNELNDKIAEDLFLPALTKLGEFCMMITIEE